MSNNVVRYVRKRCLFCPERGPFCPSPFYPWSVLSLIHGFYTNRINAYPIIRLLTSEPFSSNSLLRKPSLFSGLCVINIGNISVFPGIHKANSNKISQQWERKYMYVIVGCRQITRFPWNSKIFRYNFDSDVIGSCTIKQMLSSRHFKFTR